MTGVPSPAIDLALGLFQAPIRLEEARRRPLPDGIEALLSLLGRGHESRDAMADRLQLEPEALREACAFFVTEVLFAPGADSYRVLGLSPGCGIAAIQRHHRLLIGWLHPDRDSHDWESVHAERVNAAWLDLRTPDRRAAYDRRQPAAGFRNQDAAQPNTPPAARPIAYRIAPDSPAPLSIRPPLPLHLLAIGATALVLALLLGLWLAQPAPMQAGNQLVQVQPGSRLDAAAGNATPATAQRESSPPPPQRESSLATPERESSLATPERESSPQTPSVRPEPFDYARDKLREAKSKDAPAAALAGGVDHSAAKVATTEAVVPARPIPAATRPKAAAPAAPSPETAQRKSSPHVPNAGPEPGEAKSKDVLAAAPAAAAPPASAQPAAKTPPNPSPAIAVALAFTSHYQAGNLLALIGLFSDDARIERGGIEAIVEDYDALFENSRARQLSLSNLNWQFQDQRWVGEGHFVAQVQPIKGKSLRRIQGRIRFQLRARGDGWQIEQLNHWPDP